MQRVRIVGTGSYVPEEVITNADLERLVDTSDEWIRSRTGVVERRRAAKDQATSDLALEAARAALAMAGRAVKDLDMIVVATITPDTYCPAAACWLQSKLGMTHGVAFDVNAACAGFIFGLSVCEQFIKTGSARTILFVAGEVMTRTVNWSDRESCILWGDGAGAVILAADGEEDGTPPKHGILATNIYTDGTHGEKLQLPGGGSRTTPISHESVSADLHTLRMEGPDSFKIAVRTWSTACLETLKATGLSVDDLRWHIPHQANVRMIEAVAKRIKLEMSKVYLTIHKYGNISSATIPIALDEVVRTGQVAPGDLLMLSAFGGGLAWGASLIRW